VRLCGDLGLDIPQSHIAGVANDCDLDVEDRTEPAITVAFHCLATHGKALRTSAVASPVSKVMASKVRQLASSVTLSCLVIDAACYAQSRGRLGRSSSVSVHDGAFYAIKQY